jgi:selenocysteine lyase/cysteine desulfurase
MNHAAVSPYSTKVVEALNYFIANRYDSDDIEFYKPCISKIVETRKAIARLINATDDRIAIVKNTSEGLNILASGLEWNKGDRILITDVEFPANVYPFLNLEKRGVQVDFVKNRNGKILIEDIKNMLTPKTKLLSISHVEFLNGFKNNLEGIGKICKENGTIFAVDSIQSCGAMVVDVQKMGIDFISNGGHKWLMSPMGTGFIYVTKEIQEKIQPAYVGWLSVESAWDFFSYKLELLSTVQRFEIATNNFLGIFGMHASINLLLEVGIENIQRHLLKLTDTLISLLKKKDFKILSDENPEHRSSIVSFSGKDNLAMFEKLRKEKIFISLRENLLRVSPHFYNTEEEIEKLVNVAGSV